LRICGDKVAGGKLQVASEVVVEFKNFEEWAEQVPCSIKNDRLWDFKTYQNALFLADLVWFDSDKLFADQRGKGIAWQIIDSSGSIAANIEEGFGRGYGKDYARFLKISLGSARETPGWYYRGRHVFEPELLRHRYALADEIIANLIVVIKQQRRWKKE
jgi:four helix bundle protein